MVMVIMTRVRVLCVVGHTVVVAAGLAVGLELERQRGTAVAAVGT